MKFGVSDMERPFVLLLRIGSMIMGVLEGFWRIDSASIEIPIACKAKNFIRLSTWVLTGDKQ